MKRPSSLSQVRELLLELRAGRATFAQVARATASILELRAARVLRIWSASGQTAYLAPEDLVQEMQVVLWRAIDSWDPARCSDVVRYVDAQMGRAARALLRRTAGYPDPRRASQPARQVFLDDLLKDPGAERQTRSGFDQHRLIDCSAPDLESAIDARRTVTALRGFDRRVVELVLEGSSAEEAAREIYADPDLRIRFRLDCVRDAERAARRASRKVAASAAGAEG